MRRLPDPPLSCLITSGEVTLDDYLSKKAQLLRTIRSAAEDGVAIVQIREKELPARLLLDLVREAVTIASDAPTLIFVNDRADIAWSANADGVHLPEAGLAPSVVKTHFPDLLVGVSRHDASGVDRAATGGADLIYFGPVFDTPGKEKPSGLKTLSHVCSTVTIPVVALGGVDSSNVASVLAAGAAGVAAIRSLNEASSRKRILDQLRAR